MDTVIHFGMLKTGSSSIQQTLFNPRLQRKADFSYITLDGDFNLNRMVRLLYKSGKDGLNVEKHDGIPAEKLAAEQARTRTVLDRQIADAGDKPLIFSSEIVPTMSDADLIDLRAHFTAKRAPPSAVGYVRPPKAFIESLFQQRAKSTWGAHLSLDYLFPRYRADFEKFDRVFGRENVQFWLFDPPAFPANCVVRHFASEVGIDVPERDIVRANDGLSLPAVMLFFAYRKITGDDGGNPFALGNRLLTQKLHELEGEKLRFHSSLILPLIGRHKDDIRWMEDRMGASLMENLTAHDATAVRSEEDLLAFSPHALQWLSKNLDDPALASSVLCGEPQAVARGMDALYYQLLDGRPNILRGRGARSSLSWLGKAARTVRNALQGKPRS